MDRKDFLKKGALGTLFSGSNFFILAILPQAFKSLNPLNTAALKAFFLQPIRTWLVMDLKS